MKSIKGFLFLFLAPIGTHGQGLENTGAWYAYPLQSVAKGQCIPTAINNSGRVVGFAYSDKFETASVAFVTGPVGVGVATLTLGGTDAIASDINNSGVVVGASSTLSNPLLTRSFITDANGENIRTLTDDTRVIGANGINDAGEVTGSAFDRVNRAFITGPNGLNLRLIDMPKNATESAGVSINASGQVLGVSAGHPTGRHAFVTGPHGRGVSDLGLAKGQQNFASSINDAGQVTGTIHYKYGRRRQYITGPNGQDMRVLGYLGHEPGWYSTGADINNLGVALGVSSLTGDIEGPSALTVAVEGGRLLNLEKRIVNLPEGVTLKSSVGGINDFGQIAAPGSDKRCYIVCSTKERK